MTVRLDRQVSRFVRNFTLGGEFLLMAVAAFAATVVATFIVTTAATATVASATAAFATHQFNQFLTNS